MGIAVNYPTLWLSPEVYLYARNLDFSGCSLGNLKEKHSKERSWSSVPKATLPQTESET